MVVALENLRTVWAMNVSNGNNQLPKQRMPPLAKHIEENNPPIFGGVHLRAGALPHEGKSCPPFHIIDWAFNFHILRNNSARDLPQRERDPWLPWAACCRACVSAPSCRVVQPWADQGSGMDPRSGWWWVLHLLASSWNSIGPLLPDSWGAPWGHLLFVAGATCCCSVSLAAWADRLYFSPKSVVVLVH